MLWKKVFRVIEAYLIRNGIVNTMWCLSQRYAVSTVGFEIEQVRQYIRDQEEADGTGEQF
jgi:hypothetical protein